MENKIYISEILCFLTLSKGNFPEGLYEKFQEVFRSDLKGISDKDENDCRKLLGDDYLDGNFFSHLCRYSFNYIVYNFTLAANEFERILILIDSPIVEKYKYDKILFLKFKTNLLYSSTEVYSSLNAYDKVLDCYKKIHLTNLLLVKDNINIDDVYLYSFRSVSDYSLNDLNTQKITVSSPKVMNDPFDSLYMHWIGKDNLTKFVGNKEKLDAYSKSFNFFRIRSFVSSDSFLEDEFIVTNPAMWSYYADEHKGFVVLYKVNIKEASNWYLSKIVYTDRKVSLCTSESNMEILFSTKSKYWSHEKEVRIISYNPDSKSDFDQISLNEKSKVKSIYFGYRCDEKDIGRIKSILGNDVKYYRMELNFDDVYRLDVKSIN